MVTLAKILGSRVPKDSYACSLVPAVDGCDVNSRPHLDSAHGVPQLRSACKRHSDALKNSSVLAQSWALLHEDFVATARYSGLIMSTNYAVPLPCYDFPLWKHLL